ncbi:MAG: hypothetical protein Q4G46_15200 [Propionibacteriaceae bacterium]|nr:hypothetical protein [Propionibacteriaceae bacterium]
MRNVGLALMARPMLLRALDSVVPATVEGLTQRIEDPRGLPGDLVVGADGARSRVRAAIWGDAARSAGTWAVRGVLSRPAESPDMAAYWAGRVLFGMSWVLLVDRQNLPRKAISGGATRGFATGLADDRRLCRWSDTRGHEARSR